MPADRLLNNVLQLYRDVHDAAKTEQIIGSTTLLLTQLSNPRNLGVLTSQLLVAPAIWQRNNGARTSLRIISIYNTAAVRVAQSKEGLSPEAWVRAVVKGADDQSRRWQHLLVLTGVLMGIESQGEHSLSRGLRNTLEEAIVTAANLALDTQAHDGPLAAPSIVMALNFAFPLLGDHNKTRMNSNALLPLAIWGIVGEEGFADGQFLLVVESDTATRPGGVLDWPAQSRSSHLLQEMNKQPLMGNLGPLAKLAAFAVQHATDPLLVLGAQETILASTSRVLQAWSTARISHVDHALQDSRLTPDTLRMTWPVLMETLRKFFFATVLVLQAVVTRSFLDPYMLADATAPLVSGNTLRTLRNLCFISGRNGNNAFQQYAYVYLTSIDVISRNGPASELLLKEMLAPEKSAVNHLERQLDLFYLSLAEHLPLNLPTAACEALIIRPATAYLSNAGPISSSSVELFESAHSAVLSVLSCPQHSVLTVEMAPFYIVKLFESFPHHMSSRQFRFAFKTVLQILSPPFPIAAMEPHLAETLLEMLRGRIETAAVTPIPPKTHASQADEAVSEQSSLVLALIDSLPFLPLPFVQEWLTVAADTLHMIADPRLRETARKRFWDLLVSGEMDVERAVICVAWWGTGGGRELVQFGPSSQPAMMSGAIVRPDNGRL